MLSLNVQTVVRAGQRRGGLHERRHRRAREGQGGLLGHGEGRLRRGRRRGRRRGLRVLGRLPRSDEAHGVTGGEESNTAGEKNRVTRCVSVDTFMIASHHGRAFLPRGRGGTPRSRRRRSTRSRSTSISSRARSARLRRSCASTSLRCGTRMRACRAVDTFWVLRSVRVKRVLDVTDSV